MSSTTLHLYASQKSHEQVVRRRSNIGFKIGGLNLVHCVGRRSTPTQLNVMIFIENKDIALQIMVPKIQTSSLFVGGDISVLLGFQKGPF